MATRLLDPFDDEIEEYTLPLLAMIMAATKRGRRTLQTHFVEMAYLQTIEDQKSRRSRRSKTQLQRNSKIVTSSRTTRQR